VAEARGRRHGAKYGFSARYRCRVTTGSLGFLSPLLAFGIMGSTVALVGLAIRLSKRRLVHAQGVLLAPVGVVGIARVRWDDAHHVTRDAAALYVGPKRPFGSSVLLRHGARNPDLVEIVNANSNGVYLVCIGGIIVALGVVTALLVFLGS
jgi:hypothetical protein